MPALRDDVALKSGANLVVNLTLHTLFEALQGMPVRRRTAGDEDDWKWTLRSTANRPVLRLVPVSAGSGNPSGAVWEGAVAFVAGSDAEGFGSAPDMTTAFRVERSLFSSGTLALNGDINPGEGAGPGTVLRASYAHHLSDGSAPEISVSLRRFATPGMVGQDAADALQALAVTVDDEFFLGDFLDVSAGTEYESVQFMGRVTALRPFGSADFHLSPNTVLEYRYASSVPDASSIKGLDTALPGSGEAGPLVSLVNYDPVLERDHHQEVSLARRLGKNRFQVAWFNDRISNPALTGVGYVSGDSGEFLPDYYSGTFTWNGPNFTTNGLRAVAERDLATDLDWRVFRILGREVTATLDYAYGGALALEEQPANWSTVHSQIGAEYRQSVAVKISGMSPVCRTRWLASYRATSGENVLTPVDMFNVSAGQADPYLSIIIRQPLPGMGFIPGHMEAVVDIRNLLAQGYVPVLGDGGRTLYLVQSARAVRGGVAFTF
jgi:hypothetical protein